ncbi:MAG: hypothetical protein HBSAPP03_10230 [Phycisphaerae bacterium]|nr:MAG: hypothetical protein HBSAPP03_10230 [Phycisphaerae bacterium]
MVRIPRDLHLAAARRLVSRANDDLDAAAQRLIESASRHAIDFSLCFGTLDPGTGKAPARVRQACLAVIGAGRTAMLFLSEPEPGEGAPGVAERAACIRAACDHLGTHLSRKATLAQALPEPGDRWSTDALAAAGFVSVGTLVYLRAAPPPPRERAAPRPWPEGVTVERLSEIGALGTAAERDDADAALAQALEASYIDTLDCPELCGLRAIDDVLDSHRATGTYDPSWWSLVRDHGRPAGAMLLNRCPDLRSIELVYLGLGPTLRGKGIGSCLLRQGMDRVHASFPGWSVTCAVDSRNTPALGLYRALGFSAYTKRSAFVRPLGGTPERPGDR